MTGKLQKRFVITAMIAITLLLTVLIGAVNVSTLVLTNRQTDAVLSTLTAHRGSYDPTAPQKLPQPTNTPPFPRRPTPDDVMGARYFTVLFDSQGRITRTNLSHIYAVSDQQAREIALGHYRNGSGQYEQFRYTTTHLPNGQGSMMLFLDISAQQNTTLTVLAASCAIGLVCWLVMLLVVVLLSRRAIAPTARSIEKQKQFVTNAGHELKTPLSIILANTDALELHSGQSKWSSNIRAQVVRLNGLMQNLLTLSKMDEESVSLPMSELCAVQLVTGCTQPHRLAAEARGLTIELTAPPQLPIRGHRDSLEQLVSILLDNAVKYSSPGGNIRITLEQKDRRACLQVTNPCPPPPTADLERLFDRFCRGDHARTQSGGGCGIGLSAARAIAQAHAGSLGAHYDENTGQICFTALFG